MPKPQWLKDREAGAVYMRGEPRLCRDCCYLGRPVAITKHLGKESAVVYECDLHPGCMNTAFSICCGDWSPVDLV